MIAVYAGLAMLYRGLCSCLQSCCCCVLKTMSNSSPPNARAGKTVAGEESKTKAASLSDSAPEDRRVPVDIEHNP